MSINLTSQTKRILVYVAIGLGVLFAGRFVIRALDLYDDASSARAIYYAEKKASVAKEKAALKAIAALNKALEKKDTELMKVGGDIIKKNMEIRGLKGDLSGLEQKLKVAGTDAEKVVILTSTVGNLTNTVKLLEGVVADKEKEVGLWANKYYIALQVGDEYKKLWEQEKMRADAAEAWAKELQQDLRTCRIGSRVKTGLVAIATGTLIYTLVRGK